MPHPRPTGPTDALSSMLRAGTAAVHRAAEQQPFMRAFFAGELTREAYVDWLRRQRPLYEALERALDALPPGSAEAGVLPPSLHRAERIADDLDHLTDGAWRSTDVVTPATRAYVDRIRATADGPAGLLAHAWLRYMGNVGGRDVLRQLAARATGLDPDSRRGLAFTDFAQVGGIRAFFAEVHARLDALPFDDDEKRRAVAEADAGFRLNIALTDELAEAHDLLAP